MAKAPEKKKTSEEPGEAASADETPSLEPVKKRLSGKVIVLYIALPILVLLLGGGAGAYFLGLFGGGEEEQAKSAEASGEGEEGKPVAVFYDLPEILVNLNNAGKKETYLKIRIALELEDAKQEIVLVQRTRIVDFFAFRLVL